MITDPIFYRLFETSPETFFLLLGMPVERAREMAARYQYKALEFKETSHRADGVFLPKESDMPVYFVEVQFYRRANIYADLMAKIFTYLKQHQHDRDFCGVVLFATRSFEPKSLANYEPYLKAGKIKAFYLDEMEEPADTPLVLSIMHLIQKAEEQAPARAQELIARARSEIGDRSQRESLLQLIERILVYKLPGLGFKEIQAMFQIHDIRESRFYQEAKKDGVQEGIVIGIEKGIEKGIALTIARMAANKMDEAQIAAILEMDVEEVRKAMATAKQD